MSRNKSLVRRLDNPLEIRSAPQVDFFNQISGFLGWLGRGWYPGPTHEGVGPFRSVGSDAGKTVTPGSALELSAAWACVRLIAETIATLPLSVFQAQADGKRVEATDHPLYSLLHETPNAYMTPVEFWEMIASSILLWGNAYAVKRYIGKRLVALDPLRPEFTSIVRAEGGEIRYIFHRGTEQQNFSASEIWHIKGFGIDGLVGLSPIGMARQTLGRAMATEEASSKIFQSGLTASGFIKYAQTLKTEQRDAVRASIERFTGSSNVGKVMVLENGMEYQAITMNPADAQMIESRRFNIEEICRWYGVPPSLVGHTDKASSWASSLENTKLGFLQFGLRPYLTRIEQSARRSLLEPVERPRVFPKFNLEGLLRGDSAARAALHSSSAQNGWMTRNEIRELEDLPRIEGGDELTVQSNLLPINKLGTVVTPMPDNTPKGVSVNVGKGNFHGFKITRNSDGSAVAVPLEAAP